MTYDPRDIYSNLAKMGDSRASWHPDFNFAAAIKRQTRERALVKSVDLGGCHPQDEQSILARMGDPRAINHPDFNWERFNALKETEE